MSLWRESAVKATRKRHTCEGCLTAIEAGSAAYRYVGMNLDGDFCAGIMHPECRVAEVALNKLMDLNWDEWACLSELEDEDKPWLLAEHPVVAARMRVTA